MAASKEILYIDLEDDITSIIDKVSTSKASIIALVLPKKTAALRSSVNMRLLKNSSKKSGKKIVLITKEAALLPLAGSVGIFVSEDLKSRPVVPKFDNKAPVNNIIEGDNPDLDETMSVGELDGDEPAEIPHSSDKSEAVKKIKKSSKIKVPNFNRFRIRVILASLVVVGLIVGWYVMFWVMPEGNVTILAQTSRVPTDVSFVLDTRQDEIDLEKGLVTAQVQEVKKTITQRFEATGEKDVGEKATGLMTVQNCQTSEVLTVPKGTRFIASNTGAEFISTARVDVPGGTFTPECTSPGEANVDVVAVEAGDSKNLSPRSYSVPAYSGNVTGYGGQMSGGTTEIQKVVSVSDINKAKQNLLTKVDEEIKTQLITKFGEGDIAIPETFRTSNTDPETSVKVGDEVDEGTISAEFTYTMFGINRDDMIRLLENQQTQQIDITALSILDSGVDNVTLRVEKKISDTKYRLSANTNGFVGPEINVEALANEITGKRYSEVLDIIRSKPGVAEVDFELSPFWVASAPKPNKIVINIEVSE